MQYVYIKSSIYEKWLDKRNCNFNPRTPRLFLSPLSPEVEGQKDPPSHFYIIDHRLIFIRKQMLKITGCHFDTPPRS